MCIIVYKPAGQALPKDEYLVNSFRSNSDGAGFMYLHPKKKKVVTQKGFMDYASFREAVDNIHNLHNVPLVMHFRIGTQGLNDKKMTHPFPISMNEKVLTSTKAMTDIALTHNGIIFLTSYKGKNEEYSDTFYFVRDYATLVINDAVDYWKDRSKVALLKRLAESKLCILGIDGHVEMIGDFIEDAGCYYSNSSYKSTYVSQYSYHAGWYDDDDYVSLWDKADTDKDTEEVFAMYVPDGLYILDENDGSMEKADNDWWVYDTSGNVYLYDTDKEHCVLFDGVAVVDNEFEYCFADLGQCVKYKVLSNLPY